MSEHRPAATVLVVDDDDGVRLVTTMLLERAGYRVLDARDGQEGLTVLHDHLSDVDVVLLDVMMPRMSGHEALPAMRQLRADLPVILFSGYAESEVADHLADPAAYTSFIPKPSGIDVLTDEVERALMG